MFLDTSWELWNDSKGDYSYGLDLIKIPLDYIGNEISEDYNIRIFENSDLYEETLGGKIDVFTEEIGDGTENDAWFVCVSQNIANGTPDEVYTSFFTFFIEDNSYLSSVHYIYENWAQCVGSFSHSDTEARFVIAETEPEHTDNQVYIKIIDINFETGDYSIGTSSLFTSLVYDFADVYYSVGAQFLANSDGSIAEIYIFVVGLGLDDDAQYKAEALGFVTSVSDESRINPLIEEYNSVIFSGQDDAAATGTLDDNIYSQYYQGEVDSGRRLKGRKLQETSHTISYETAETFSISSKQVLPESYYGLTISIDLNAVSQD